MPPVPVKSGNCLRESTATTTLVESNINLEVRRCPSHMDIQINKEALAALQMTLKQQEQRLKFANEKRGLWLHKLVAKYDNRIAEAMSKKEVVRGEKASLAGKQKEVIVQRDSALTDLRNVEQAFSDVHRKYERAKKILEHLKYNEELLKRRDEEIQDKIVARDRKIDLFAVEMQECIARLHRDYVAKAEGLENDNIALTAYLRRCDLRLETLQSELEQKQKENLQLNNLADELVGKTGSKGWAGS